MIDIADTVFHRPTGETWVVARVDYDEGKETGQIYWMGWPPGCAQIEDCELKEKATPEQRRRLLEEIAESSHGDDPRVSNARYMLEMERQALQEEEQ